MEDPNIIKLLETENQLLRQAIIGLACESNFLFCFSCFNYGKRGDYYATTCVRCGEWTCEDCSGIHHEANCKCKYCDEDGHKVNNIENYIEYCGPCYEEIKDKDKTVILSIMEQAGDDLKPLDWDKFINLFNKDSVVDYITDMINDFFESGENYQYEIHHLNLSRNNEGSCMIGFYFEIKDEYKEGDGPDEINTYEINTSLEELEEDLLSYLYDGMDGFHFGSDSEYFNSENLAETETNVSISLFLVM